MKKIKKVLAEELKKSAKIVGIAAAILLVVTAVAVVLRHVGLSAVANETTAMAVTLLILGVVIYTCHKDTD